MWKAWTFIATVGFLLGATGCQSASPRGGGGGEQEGFKIIVPTADTQIKQGETHTVQVMLQRGDYFKRDVRLEMRASEGIGVEPGSALIRASDKPETPIRVSAGRNAALGEYRIYVRGVPESGEPTSVEFRVKVVAP
jgi:uncharacterized membrane protein